jgi:hypothetical protein
MAGLEYSMRPHTAAGLGALWAGVAIHRPLPGEVFASRDLEGLLLIPEEPATNTFIACC